MNTDSIYFIKTESQSIQIRFTSVVCCNELLVHACNSSHITCTIQILHGAICYDRLRAGYITV